MKCGCITHLLIRIPVTASTVALDWPPKDTEEDYDSETTSKPSGKPDPSGGWLPMGRTQACDRSQTDWSCESAGGLWTSHASMPVLGQKQAQVTLSGLSPLSQQWRDCGGSSTWGKQFPHPSLVGKFLPSENWYNLHLHGILDIYKMFKVPCKV